MAYDDLRDWIKTLEKHGELKRIREEVSPELEITEITDRVSKIGASRQAPAQATAGKYAPGGPALLFENIKGHPGHKVFINQFGSERRMALALGVEQLERDRRAHHRPDEHEGPRGPARQAQDAAATGRAHQRLSEDRQRQRRAVQRSHSQGQLRPEAFPILKCWPHDGGRFITLPCVHTRDPRTGKRNIGMYRMQVYDGQTTGMHWQRQKVAAEHYRKRCACGGNDSTEGSAHRARGGDGRVGRRRSRHSRGPSAACRRSPSAI